jgi:hypothetical protein
MLSDARELFFRVDDVFDLVVGHGPTPPATGLFRSTEPDTVAAQLLKYMD